MYPMWCGVTTDNNLELGSLNNPAILIVYGKVCLLRILKYNNDIIILYPH